MSLNTNSKSTGKIRCVIIPHSQPDFSDRKRLRNNATKPFSFNTTPIKTPSILTAAAIPTPKRKVDDTTSFTHRINTPGQDDEHQRLIQASEPIHLFVVEKEKNREDESSTVFDALFATPYTSNTSDIIPCDVVLALRSLVQRYSAAFIPLLPTNTPTNETITDMFYHKIPFVLKPMIHHSFLSRTCLDPTNHLSQMSSCQNEKNDWDRGCLINASTGVHQDILDACQQNVLRRLILLGSANADESTRNQMEDDVAIVETKDYVVGVWDASCINSSSDQENYHDAEPTNEDWFINSPKRRRTLTREVRRAIIEWFLSYLCVWTDIYVTYDQVHEAVLHTLKQQRSTKKDRTLSLSSKSTIPSQYDPADTKVVNSNRDTNGTAVLPNGIQTQDILDYLLSIQVLLPRHVIGSTNASMVHDASTSFWFTLPLVGRATKALTFGRKKVMSKLKHSFYKEMKMDTLLSSTIAPHRSNNDRRCRKQIDPNSDNQSISFPTPFFVRDLLSRGIVRTRTTPAGQFIQLRQAS